MGTEEFAEARRVVADVGVNGAWGWGAAGTEVFVLLWVWHYSLYMYCTSYLNVLSQNTTTMLTCLLGGNPPAQQK